MARIASIEISHHRIAVDPPFHPTWDSRPRPTFTASLVAVTDEDGRTGYGSGDAMPGFAGHEELFVGEDALDLPRHFRIIENISFHYGKCWPLDLALWDLAGKTLGQPVWRLVGARGRSLAAYASFGQRREAAATADQARRALEAGFKAIKLRFFRADWKAEIAIVEAVRAAVGDRLDIMVDCNQAWRMQWDTAPARDVKEALKVIRALEPLDVYWVEEPLFRGDWDGLRRLRDSTGIRIAGGELTRELHEARHMVEAGCFDVLQTDVALAGGISGLLPIAHLCAQRGVVFTPHTWGNGIMLAAACHLTAGSVGAPYIEYPWDPPSWAVEHRDFMFAAPIGADREGVIHLDDAPGLGLVLDHERLAATRL